MNKLIFIIVFLFFCRICSAQTPSWIWLKSAGGISNDYSNAICSDANGNVYATGTFQGSTISFGSNTLYNGGTGALDIFVVKYDASGNIIWAKSGNGISNDYTYGICNDMDGNVYITGYFQSPTITFGSVSLTNTSTYSDIFVIKYDSAGNVLWAQSATGSLSEMSYGICSDDEGNVYITGTFGYSSNIIFGSDTLINRGGYDIFLAKYDGSGNLLWTKNEGGAGGDYSSAICTDTFDNVYITGFFQNHAIFGNDTLIANGNTGIFTAKYDTYGNYIWAKSAIGIPSGTYNYSNGIAANSDGVYITGSFQNSIIFGDTLGNAGSNSIFVAKYDSSGNALWGRSPGGTSYDYGTGISTNENGNVWVTGYFESSYLNFGGLPVLNNNIGYNDIFVAEYDADGNVLQAIDVGGQDNDIGMGICTNQDGSVYLTGYFGSYPINFGNNTVTNNGSFDIYLAKLALITGIEDNSLSDWNVFPNPFSDRLNVSLTNNILSEIILYDLASRKILRQEFINYFSLNLEHLAKGIYIYEVRDSNGLCKKGKVVKN